MKHQSQITVSPDTAKISPVPVSPSVHVSLTTDRFPAWMERHQTWIVSAVSVMTIVTLLWIGWAAYTVQQGLIQSRGYNLVQVATDAASKLDLLILERYRDIQLLSTAPIIQSQNPDSLTIHLRDMVKAHPAYQWIGVTDSQWKIIASTDTSRTSLDRSQSHWFQLARTITDVRILDAHLSDGSERTSAITLVAPLRTADGRFLGAIAAV